MANTKPRVTSRDRELLANETLAGRNLIRAKDDDGDTIQRYRITQRASDPSGGINGYFMFKGVKMALNKAFSVLASELQQLVFVSASRGQRPNGVDNIFIRAFDGTDWSDNKKISVRTLHNRFRPVVKPIHQEIISDRSIEASELFSVSDRDGSSTKYYTFRDLTPDASSAYLEFKGVNMQGAGWFQVNPNELNKLSLVGGSVSSRDRIQIRAFDGRFGSRGKVALVNTLERPIVGSTTNVIFNELERKRISTFVTDAGSVPPITTYEFMDLNGAITSGQVRRGFISYAANTVHSVSASVMSTLDFQGGLYDVPSRDGFAIRGHNGEFWSPWQQIELITEPHYIDSLKTGEDWTQYLPAPIILGDPLTVTFSFLQRVPDYYDPGAAERNNFGRLNNFIRANVRSVLAQISEVINIRFVEVSDLVGGVLRFGSTDKGQTNPGHAYIPADPTVDSRGGDVWFNNFVDFPTINWPGVYSNQDPGTTGLAFMRRFISESLGLRVPSTGFPLLPAATDNHRYTSLAHNFVFQVPVSDGDNFGYAETTQMYDNAALRTMYGAKADTRIGNDVYTFDNDRHTVMTLIDMGGNDSIDLGNQVRGATVDLRQGAFSSFGEELGFFGPEPGIRNLGISYGTEIENVLGTNFGDRLTGNELDNTIFGRDGADIINGLGGDDLLVGGRGNDIYRFDLFGGNDVIDDQDNFSIDRLEIHSHSDDLSSFTDHLSFRRVGNDLVINLTLNQNRGRDLIDGTVRIKNMTGTSGVETLRLVDNSGNNIEGVDIDLTSVFAISTNVAQHLQITGADGAYGKLVSV